MTTDQSVTRTIIPPIAFLALGQCGCLQIQNGQNKPAMVMYEFQIFETETSETCHCGFPKIPRLAARFAPGLLIQALHHPILSSCSKS